MFRYFFEFFIIDMTGRACEKLVLVFTLSHCDYDHGDEAENHAQDFDSIDRLPVVVITQNGCPERTRLKQNHQQ